MGGKIIPGSEKTPIKMVSMKPMLKSVGREK